MKKFKVLAVVAALAAVGLFAVPLAAHSGAHAGSHMRSGEQIVVGKDEVMDSTVYLAGSNITVEGTVKGDLYCAGQNVDVTGTVEGDVLCAGQNVTISGNVLGDVRVAGQTVKVSGPVAHSLTALGQTVTIMGSTIVNNDATVLGTLVQLGGSLGRDVVVGGQNVTMAGTVGRDVTATSQQLTLSSGARIGGNIDYTSNNEVTKEGGAAVAGKTTKHDPPKDHEQAQAGWAAQFWGMAFWFGAWVVLGLLLMAVSSRNLKATAETMTKQSGWSLLTGLAALILTPIVAVVLIVTFIGAPAGVVLLLFWGSAMLMAYAYSGYALGQWVAAQTGWNLRWPMLTSLLLGLALLVLLMLIPIVGGLCGFLALVWGLGGIVLESKRRMKTQQADVKPAKKSKA